MSYRDFTPLAAIAQSPYILVVPVNSEYKTLDDLKKIQAADDRHCRRRLGRGAAGAHDVEMRSACRSMRCRSTARAR